MIKGNTSALDKKFKIELRQQFFRNFEGLFFNASELIKMELSIAVTIDICF